MTTLSPIAVLKQSSGIVTACDWSNHGRKLAVAVESYSNDPHAGVEIIKITFTPDNRKPLLKHIANCVGHKGKVSSVRFTQDGTLLATTGADDFTAKIWDSDSGEQLKSLKRHTAAVNSCDWSPDGASKLNRIVIRD
jgi:WD40 repeat protein